VRGSSGGLIVGDDEKAAGFVNRLRRGLQFDDCENTNRRMVDRYAMGSDAGLLPVWSTKSFC